MAAVEPLPTGAAEAEGVDKAVARLEASAAYNQNKTPRIKKKIGAKHALNSNKQQIKNNTFAVAALASSLAYSRTSPFFQYLANRRPAKPQLKIHDFCWQFS